MRNFQEIASEYNLKKYSDSRWGTLYFIPPERGKPQLMVRHFDKEWLPELIEPFAKLTEAAQAWIVANKLDVLVRISQILETGTDFYARRHHYYHVSMASYDKDKVEPPMELEILRDQLPLYIEAAPTDELEGLIFEVLDLTLLKPTRKTFWEDDEERFVVAELKVTTELLEQAAQIFNRSVKS